MYVVYILYSNTLDKYYVGHTADFVNRLSEHNRGKGNFTSKGIPWILIHSIDCETRSDAVRLELKIKKRGIKRYLQDVKIL